ncbi:AMP-binding protein [Alkalihalobacillus hwajinpoensis]|uniref:AMP-binding protein n=1 Tax=Guptibacillus hwajinpoensis TaxID=208199 RepID=UPI0018833D06|nr:AMP-binding protein [Pseudalkalibacillus hwajinpoensis]MBF0706521.1 AMP-binding protein [Pseudalkalibacillus hwajinpoensis]
MTKLLHETIGSMLERQVDQFGNKEAVVYSKEKIRYTFEEFNNEVNRVAKALLGLGVTKGENVAVWATNVPEWLLLQFATAKVGAVLVTINTNYQSSELEYVLKQSESTRLFLIDGFKGTSYPEVFLQLQKSNDQLTVGKCAIAGLPYLKDVIYIGTEERSSFMKWRDFLKGSVSVTDKALEMRNGELDPDDVINMQYTSGTTGFPKGVMLTHNNILNNGFQIGQCMELTHNDRLCIPVPFFHCFGCVLGTLAAFSAGATIFPIIEFEPELVLRTVEKERCTALHGVPTMFISELSLAEFESYNLSSLRTGIMAGSPCPIEVMKNVMKRMNMVEITIAYGQTEASPVITQTRTNDPLEYRVNTVGRALPGVEVKIVDPVSGLEVPSGEAGELCTRGYHVMRGYYNMPEATNQVIDEEGWLHTGDIAKMDSEGYVEITGRLKDMIIRGGENVYPREIEEFLYSHPSVQDVQVIGVPDEKYGEKVVACIQLKEKGAVNASDILLYCKGKIARYKVPAHVFFVDEYPMTASGKIQKYKLRESAVEWANLNSEISK